MAVLGRLAVWALVAFNIFAIVWVTMTAFKPHSEIFSSPFGLPEHPTVDNFTTAWFQGKFGVAFLNTALLTIVCGIVVLVLACPAAYMIARRAGFASSSLYMTFVAGIGVPLQVIIIPLYLVMQQMNLLNNRFGLGLAMVVLALPFSILLLTGFFSSLPNELREAAAIDGLGPFRTFVLIMLPLAKGGIITLATLNLISMWNETFLALVLIASREKQVLSVALLNFINSQQFSGADYGAIFAGVMILIVPMIIIYSWLGRRIVEGMTMGSGK
ncbi:carbohydrate ABC transporter permease [Tessaracoccus sp. OH4464_COT-324]|uniref:carbohydrate ABC transporter permease n=1 Tax=Tessaracoccus sp. OH4464_COT-324 TaxID=2491059 RepID=UPI000F62C9A5|nr:carbohydrate ABC transporter permease [Tessaracoccus sp. OH4464_COT-324]RRD45949.1 carbohydrate ABC transporter permease [Tessaracoccus sp. OH4464_COT-324]